MHKSRASYRDGYKAHLAAEPETGLVTAARLTPASTGDGPTGVQLLSDEPDALEVLADSAYGGGETRAGLRAAGHCRTIKPLPLRAAVPGGYTKDDFGKTLRVHPHEAELAAARRRASDPDFIASYRRWRPMVERSIAWLVADGNRRVPYRGLVRNQQWLSIRVAAINLRRLVAMGLDHHSAGWVLA
jgi:Transposase DDE domain